MFRPAKSKFTYALLTLAIALLPVLSGISGGLHMLLVRHVVCRTHGEFIHADDNCAGQVASSPGASTFDANSDDDSANPSFRRDSGRGELKDEHCQIVQITRASFVSWRSTEGSGLILRERLVSEQGARAAREPAIDRILLAPKQSPPI